MDVDCRVFIMNGRYSVHIFCFLHYGINIKIEIPMYTPEDSQLIRRIHKKGMDHKIRLNWYLSNSPCRLFSWKFDILLLLLRYKVRKILFLLAKRTTRSKQRVVSWLDVKFSTYVLVSF